MFLFDLKSTFKMHVCYVLKPITVLQNSERRKISTLVQEEGIRSAHTGIQKKFKQMTSQGSAELLHFENWDSSRFHLLLSNGVRGERTNEISSVWAKLRNWCKKILWTDTEACTSLCSNSACWWRKCADFLCHTWSFWTAALTITLVGRELGNPQKLATSTGETACWNASVLFSSPSARIPAEADCT